MYGGNQNWRAEFGVYFEPGSTISCTTCFDKEIKGEVLAYDVGRKLLILKCSIAGQSPSKCNVEIVNLLWVKDINLLNDCNVPLVHSDLDTAKLRRRVKLAKEEKQRIISALSGGVSAEGQKLYYKISKTLKDVCWNEQDIIVNDDPMIRITPPYRLANIKGREDSPAFQHARKVVEKHYQDLESEPKTSSRKSGKMNEPHKPSNKSSSTEEEIYHTCNGHSSPTSSDVSK